MQRFFYHRRRGFSLVEILVVVTIIGMLAGISIPAVGGAMASARRSKVKTMTHQIRTALIQFNTEYGYFPTNGINSVTGLGSTAPTLALVLIGDSSTAATNANPRRIAFLEVPNEFTFGGAGDVANRGIVTPSKFYATGQSNFQVVVDSDYDGQVTAREGTRQTNLRTTIAVWCADPKEPNTKSIGTWK